MKNSRNAIVLALKRDPLLDDSKIKIIDKGSSCNNTNVKLQADVDFSLVDEDTFFYGLPAGCNKESFNIVDGSRNFISYKQSVIRSIYKYFNTYEIDNTKDKCTRIKENSSRVDIDIVPTFRYRLYSLDGNYEEGVAFYSDSDILIINFPEQHTENGIQKNNITRRRYKRIVRILKRFKSKMKEDGVLVSDAITSFLIESLVWNVRDDIFNQSNNYSDILKNVLADIYHNISKDWYEVSNILKLFDDDRKWSVDDVRSFINQVWIYGDFK